ncbi:MAG TPA: hypothetical protein VH297_12075 [Gaiellaceae bacterium]
MRRALVAAGLAALAAPAAALADSQQVLLPGPTPYPTPSPPLVTVTAPPYANLPFRIRARAHENVTAGVDENGQVVSLRVRQRLLLTGTGDYLIVVSAPLLDVTAAPGSESQPGLRRGQILWAGFSSKHKLLAADATLRPSRAAPFLPVRLEAHRDGDRYTLTLTNATTTSQFAFDGAASTGQVARLLDQTRRQSLAHERLGSVYVTIDGLVGKRPGRTPVSAPVEVRGVLRFPSAPASARGGAVHGRTVSFAFVLGDGSPLRRTVEATGGGEPHVRLVARPTSLVRELSPPAGRSWVEAAAARRIPAGTLLRRLIDTRMQLVRSDQYQAYLSNPDLQGTNRTVYVYETAAPQARKAASSGGSSSGGDGTLVLLLAIGGSVVAAGAALVAWAHS